jgi:hypothetical protein
MSCDDLDRLRTQSPCSSSSTWPTDARRHLASCERCARLQASLDSPQLVDFPEALQQRIEAAILPGLVAVPPLPSALRVTVTLLLCSIVAIAAANSRLGLAGWHARSSLQALVEFCFLGGSLLLLASILADRMTPGFSHKAPLWLYLAVPLLALLAADTVIFGSYRNPAFVPLALSCWEIGVTCAAISAPLFWLVLRRGFTLNPKAHGATVGLLAGLTGVAVLEIYCPYLDRLHISVAHIGAAATSGLVGAGLGAIKGRIQGPGA